MFKTSELSPRSQAIVAGLFPEVSRRRHRTIIQAHTEPLELQAGLPPGALNIISISTETAPQLTAEIIAHPMVRKLAVRLCRYRYRYISRGWVISLQGANVLDISHGGPQILEALRPIA